MYRYQTLVSIAQRNGWKEGMGGDSLPLYLPVNVLHNVQVEQPENPINAAVTAYTTTVMGVTLDQLQALVEPSRTLGSIYIQRVQDPQQQQQQRERMQQQPAPSPKGSGDPQEGKDKSDSKAKPRSGTGSGSGSSEGKSEGKDEGEGKGKGGGSKPQFGLPDGKDGGKPAYEKTSIMLSQEYAGSNSDRIKEWMEKEDERLKAQEEYYKSLLIKPANPNGGVRGSYGTHLSRTNAADHHTAEKLRGILDKMIGAFDLFQTPLWDGKKLVKRLLTNRTLVDARKEQEGRPSILYMNDISGSCSAMSQMVTQTANSACTLGTIDADIYSLMINDDTWSAASRWGSNPSYHNGRELVYSYPSTINKAMHNNIAENLTTNEALREALGLPPDTPISNDERGAVASLIALSRELNRPLTMNDITTCHYLWEPYSDENLESNQKFLGKNNGMLPHVRELQALSTHPLMMNDTMFKMYETRLDRANTALKAYASDNKLPYNDANMGLVYAADRYGTHERKLGALLMSNALIDKLNADIIIYYTDSDGTAQVRRLLAGLKPHQQLFVLTYASFPNDVVDDRFVIRINKKAQDEYTRKGTTRRHHARTGDYGEPPKMVMGDGETIQGLSTVAHAFSPSGDYDFDYLPEWFGKGYFHPNQISHYQQWATVPNAAQLTVIPNVTDIEGYIDAMQLIAAPERLHLAREGGKNMRRRIDAAYAPIVERVMARGRGDSIAHPIGNSETKYVA